MERNKIICFKICYLMGMKTYDLYNTFPFLCRCCDNIDYFNGMQAVKKYRDISMVYYLLIRRSVRLSTSEELHRLFESVLKIGTVGDTLQEFKITYGECSLVSVLNELSLCSNSLLDTMFSEIELPVSREIFSRLFFRDALSEINLQEMRFVIERSKPPFKFAFGTGFLLNHNLYSFLYSDSKFRERINVITLGAKLPVLQDTSRLYEYVDKKCRSKLKTSASLKKYTLVSKISYISKNVDDIYIKRGEALVFEGLVTESLLNTLSKSHSISGHILIPLPVSDTIYNTVVEGDYDNVFFLARDRKSE